jgi:hypothetical protein
VNHNRRTPHQGGTKAFKDLTFKERALSINGSIANLERACGITHGLGQDKRREENGKF